MLSVLNNLARNAHDVAFLGCPSIGALFSQVSRSRVTLFDVDCELLRTLESHCSPAVMLVEYDVAFDVPQELQDHYGFVFSDPPWGTRLLQGFLARTAQLTRAGGFAAITLPQALTRPGLADEVKEGFDYLIRTLVFGTVQEPSDSTQNPNNDFLQIPAYSSEIELRADFYLNFRNLKLEVKPRVTGSWQKWEEGSRDGDTDTDTDLYVNEWMAGLSLTDDLFVSYGKENVQWGPSYLFSPSNPFFNINTARRGGSTLLLPWTSGVRRLSTRCSTGCRCLSAMASSWSASSPDCWAAGPSIRSSISTASIATPSLRMCVMSGPEKL